MKLSLPFLVGVVSAILVPRPGGTSGLVLDKRLTNSSSTNSTNSTSLNSTSSNSQETVPIELTWGVTQVPNVLNKTAVDANAVAPGYLLVNATRNACGVTGILKLIKESNIYGYDFDYLRFNALYQADTRLSVHIEPTKLDDVFVLPSDWVKKPGNENGNESCTNFAKQDLLFRHSRVNESFWFEVVRLSTSDVIFSTKNNPLVFANQFVQFNTSLPLGHVITGLGEAIHGFTNPPGTVRTLYANDVGDPIDGNIYGVHPFYIDQRYSNQSKTPDVNATFNFTAYPGVNGTKVLTGYNGTSINTTNATYTYNSTFYQGSNQVNSSWAHGVWWRTAAPQEVIIEEESLTWRSLNGVIDLYFFLGPTPKDVIQQYVAEIGLPALQPYWAFGYHQCRWGYSDVDELAEVVDLFKAGGLQLETIWSDIDYMDSYKDFTTDPHRFPEDDFRDFLDELHDNHQHYVPIVDAAIYHPNPNNKTDDNYTTFHEGMDQDVFLKNPDGSLYIGAVWPGYTVFPDFLAKNITEYWNDQFLNWFEKVPFDGIWLDMNEVSSFCVGSCGTGRIDTNPVHPPFAVGNKQTEFPEGFENSNSSQYSSMEAYISSLSAASASSSVSSVPSGNSTVANSGNVTTTTTTITVASTTYVNYTASKYYNTLETGVGNINYPPYVINNAQEGNGLEVHAVSPNATHQDGTIEYNIHNLYGLMQTKATYHALTKVFPNKRPFIISRSTYSGSGNYTGHWGGDNASKWAYAYFSIPQALTMGMLGLPFFGVDVCGFNGNSDLELCSRWMQLGSFFPFYRNHNVLGALPQEPYVWDEVLRASKITMDIRYSLLPYYYTLMYVAHQTGLPVLRALLWEFPDDPKLADVSTQFFVGEALIVTPVLEPNVTSVKGTFPGSGSKEVYYDWYTHQEQEFEDGKNETLKAPLGHIPLHIRGGNVLPMQEPKMTTAECRNSSWSLLVALDLDESALGKLYVDDGESLDPESLFVDFSALSGQLSATSYGEYNVTQPLANITILGVLDEPSDVQFNDEAVDFKFTNNTIYITNLEDQTKDGAFANDFSLTWE